MGWWRYRRWFVMVLCIYRNTDSGRRFLTCSSRRLSLCIILCCGWDMKNGYVKEKSLLLLSGCRECVSVVRWVNCSSRCAFVESSFARLIKNRKFVVKMWLWMLIFKWKFKDVVCVFFVVFDDFEIIIRYCSLNSRSFRRVARRFNCLYNLLMMMCVFVCWFGGMLLMFDIDVDDDVMVVDLKWLIEMMM